MLNVPKKDKNAPLPRKKENKKFAKKEKKNNNKIWNFTILYITLVETFLGVYLNFGVLCTFRQDVVWKFSFPYGPMVTKTKKKKMVKIQNLEVRQYLYNFGIDPP